MRVAVAIRDNGNSRILRGEVLMLEDKFDKDYVNPLDDIFTTTDGRCIYRKRIKFLTIKDYLCLLNKDQQSINPTIDTMKT
jgi:hypothetical protein